MDWIWDSKYWSEIQNSHIFLAEENGGKELRRPSTSIGHAVGFLRSDPPTAPTSDLSSFGMNPEKVGDKAEVTSGEPRSIVEALTSLEGTIKRQCALLSQKSPPVAAVAASPVMSSVVSAAMLAKQATASTSGTSPPHVLPMRRKRQLVRPDRVTVSIRVVFLKIGEIDTMKENFAADAFMQAKWREPLFDGHIEIVSTHAL